MYSLADKVTQAPKRHMLK